MKTSCFSVRKGLLLAGLMVLLLVAAGNTQAGLVVLDTPNTALSAYNGPYADITYTLGSPNGGVYTTAAITVDARSPYLFGGNNALGLNINGSFTLATNLEGTSFQRVSPPNTVDGFGYFNFVLEQSTMNSPVDYLFFELTGSWENEDAFFMDGELPATAHISTTSGTTGWASTSTPVPLPPAAYLLGAGLIGLIGVRRRFQK